MRQFFILLHNIFLTNCHVIIILIVDKNIIKTAHKYSIRFFTILQPQSKNLYHFYKFKTVFLLKVSKEA